MKYTENIKKLIKKSYFKNLDVPASAETDERILGDALAAMEESIKARPALVRPNIWRIIMKSRMTKLAAAAVIAVAVLLPLSYGAAKLIKRFITISQLSAIRPNFVYGAALSPDGKYFAGATANSQLVVIDISTDEQRHLAENCHGPVVWSADGNEIAVRSYGKGLLAVSLKTGKTRTLMEDPPWLEDWSADGRRILGVRTPKSGVHSAVMVNLQNKEETVLAEEWASPRFSPNGDWVSYATNEADQSVLHLRQIDGTSHVKYTDFPGGIGIPLWSPAGNHIVFTGTQKGIDGAHKDLWALRVEGNRFVGAPLPVVPNVEHMAFYNWSQNGQLAYRTGFQLGGMFVLPVDPQTGKATGAPRRLVRASGFGSHCWSPDGKQIALRKRERGEWVFISASTGQKIQELSLAEIEYIGRGMSWSPDGRLIAFGGRDKEKRTGVFLITVKTGEVKLLVPLETTVPNLDPTWAPDSKTIAYGYKFNVYVVNVEDGKPRRITAPEAREHKVDRRPAFAPDGRSVAYMAGRRILVATTISGKETREIFRLKNDKFGINIYDWSPDGRHIVFTPGNKEIWCVATDGGEPFQIADISNLGDKVWSWMPKWSPTGDSISFKVSHEKVQYWVMENFLPTAVASAGK
jgi:Tol biopolymer transport system component